MAEEEEMLGEEELGDLLDSWARGWEQEFARFSAAEDKRLLRVAEQVRQLAAHGLSAQQERVGAAYEARDARARQMARLDSDVGEARQAHAAARLRQDAAQGRSDACNEALQSAEDLVRDITAGMEARRLEREAKRREERRARDAAAEARRRGRPSARSDQERPRGVSAPPKPAIRTPGPKKLEGFAAYDAAWGQFERRVAAGARLGFDDVPWPDLLSSVSGIGTEDDAKVRKEKLRAAVLRWHPDKWGPVMELVVEEQRAKVIEGVKGVTRRILEERKRFGR